ncbi:MAG: SiaC family regulatory phosphoprotein [Marinoscillum sp.]
MISQSFNSPDQKEESSEGRVTKKYNAGSQQLSSIKFDAETGTLILKGNSDQSALHHFYFPIMSQIALYFEKETDLAVGIFFTEMNVSSLRIIFNLFKVLSGYTRAGANIQIKWFAQAFDKELYNTAKDFDQLYDLNMEVILSGS